MKKILSILMATMILVTTLGFAPTVYAEDVDEEDVIVKGAGTLTAEGDGIAVIGGRGIVNIRGNGILWVRDKEGNATIEVTGYGKKKEYPDGWVQYAGFHGKASVKGRSIRIVLAGTGIDLHAKGIGAAFLWGHGSYEINGVTGMWEAETLGTRIKVASDNELVE